MWLLNTSSHCCIYMLVIVGLTVRACAVLLVLDHVPPLLHHQAMLNAMTFYLVPSVGTKSRCFTDVLLHFNSVTVQLMFILMF